MTPLHEELRAIVTLEMQRSECWALAELCKRITWDEMRRCAVDENEAYSIRSAVDQLAGALIKAGFTVR